MTARRTKKTPPVTRSSARWTWNTRVTRWASVGGAVLFFAGGVTWFVRAEDSHVQGAENTTDIEIIKESLARKVHEEETLERACKVGSMDPQLCYIRGFPHPDDGEAEGSE